MFNDSTATWYLPLPLYFLLYSEGSSDTALNKSVCGTTVINITWINSCARSFFVCHDNTIVNICQQFHLEKRNCTEDTCGAVDLYVQSNFLLRYFWLENMFWYDELCLCFGLWNRGQPVHTGCLAESHGNRLGLKPRTVTVHLLGSLSSFILSRRDTKHGPTVWNRSCFCTF